MSIVIPLCLDPHELYKINELTNKLNLLTKIKSAWALKTKAQTRSDTDGRSKVGIDLEDLHTRNATGE